MVMFHSSFFFGGPRGPNLCGPYLNAQFSAMQIEKCQHPFFVAQDGFTNLEVSTLHFAFFPRGLALAPSRRSKLGKVRFQHAPWLEGFFVTPLMKHGVHW